MIQKANARIIYSLFYFFFFFYKLRSRDEIFSRTLHVVFEARDTEISRRRADRSNESE